MAIDATFWVAVSFIIFFGGLIYLKVPQKINEILNKLISDIKNEIDESEKLRTEAKTLLDNAQKKLDTAQSVSKEILAQAKKDSDNLIIELNDKFHKSSEIKKNSTENKINLMKDAAIKEIKDASIKVTLCPFALRRKAAAIPPNPDPITMEFIYIIYSLFCKIVRVL